MDSRSRLSLVRDNTGRSKDGRVLSLWLCQCGVEKELPRGRVIGGHILSCGCLLLEAVRRIKSHGHKGPRPTREYNSWQSMRQRCLNKSSKDYPIYGGRGISICDRWNDFSLFLLDMGKRPPGKTLERINSMMGYFPGNVKWGDGFEQARNRRCSRRWFIKGVEFQSISDAAKYFSVSEQTIYRWVFGQYDRRRDSFTEPRPDCSAEMKYNEN